MATERESAGRLSVRGASLRMLRVHAPDPDRERTLAVLAVALMVTVASVRVWAMVYGRWHDLETAAHDLAYFDQIVWNTANARWFETSFLDYNFMGQHFQPVLLPFALPYRFGAGPLFLTSVQAVVTIAAAPVLFMAATRFGLRPALAAGAVATYLAGTYLHRALEFDFHPEVMVALPAFASAWAIAAGRFRVAAALALTCLLFKEDAVFVALALSGLLWWRGGRLEGMATTAIAIAWTAFAYGIWMPHIRGGEPTDLVLRYEYLIGDWRGADVLRPLIGPRPLIERLLAPAQLWTATLFVLGTAPLMLARPWMLVLLAPGLVLALLSAHPPQHALELHYAAELVPVAVLGGVVGTMRLARRVPAVLVAAAMVAPVVVVSAALSPLSPFAPSEGSPPTAARSGAVAEAVALVPEEAPVSAQSNMMALLSQREHVWEFPGRWPQADWVVVDGHGHRSSQSLGAGYEAELARVHREYDLVFDRAGVRVFARPQRAAR